MMLGGQRLPWPCGLMSKLGREGPTAFQSRGYSEGFVQTSWHYILGQKHWCGCCGGTTWPWVLLRSRKPQACWTGFRVWQVDTRGGGRGSDDLREEEGVSHLQFCPRLFAGRLGTRMWRQGKETFQTRSELRRVLG